MADTYVIDANGKATILKDPDATLDYIWDWTLYLAEIGDTIASKSIIVQSPLTIVSSSIVGTTVVAFISDGVVGNTYTATCRIVTAGGRTDDRTINLKIKER